MYVRFTLPDGPHLWTQAALIVDYLLQIRVHSFLRPIIRNCHPMYEYRSQPSGIIKGCTYIQMVVVQPRFDTYFLMKSRVNMFDITQCTTAYSAEGVGGGTELAPLEPGVAA